MITTRCYYNNGWNTEQGSCFELVNIGWLLQILSGKDQVPDSNITVYGKTEYHKEKTITKCSCLYLLRLALV